MLGDLLQENDSRRDTLPIPMIETSVKRLTIPGMIPLM
jgi:hypothetical protein